MRTNLRKLIISELSQPTDVKIVSTNNASVFAVSWKFKTTSELGYFKISYKVGFWQWSYTFTPEIPAKSRSYNLTLSDATPGTQIWVYVYPYTKTGEKGPYSAAAGLIVPARK